MYIAHNVENHMNKNAHHRFTRPAQSKCVCLCVMSDGLGEEAFAEVGISALYVMVPLAGGQKARNQVPMNLRYVQNECE